MPEKHQIDLADYRLEKAKERLQSASTLIASGSYSDSVGRSYYAIFTAARALLALIRSGQQEAFRCYFPV